MEAAEEDKLPEDEVVAQIAYVFPLHSACLQYTTVTLFL